MAYLGCGEQEAERFGVEKETTCRERRDCQPTMASNVAPHRRIHVGRGEIDAVCSMPLEGRVRLLAQARRSVLQRAHPQTVRRRSTEDYPPRVVAVKVVLDLAPTTLLGTNGRDSAKRVNRIHAMAPAETAPRQAKTSRQNRDGTPIRDIARTT